MQPGDTHAGTSRDGGNIGRSSPAGNEGVPGSHSGQAASEVPSRFDPDFGLGGSTGQAFERDVRTLLHRRLRLAALLLFAGFGGFLVHTIVQLPPGARGGALVLTHAAVTALLGLAGGLLCTKREPSLRQLRWLEIGIFGAAGLFFVLMRLSVARLIPVFDIQTGRFVPVDLLPANYVPPAAGGPGGLPLHPEAVAFAPYTVIPWILLIQLYGVFIPSTLRRAAVTVGLMACAPIAVLLLGARGNPDLAVLLRTGDLTAVLLWMLLCGVAGVYGSWRFGKLRKDAFDASQVGPYTLQERLGSGGMGEVYLARHRLLKRSCAVKLIRPEKAGDSAAIARFEGEVQATARLTHPNTVEIFDYGRTDDGTFYYVMEYLPGLSLRGLVDRFGPLPPARVVYLLRQVCQALTEAHASGLIHRDIKPGNIIAAERGGLYDVAKLLDFGLVKSQDAESSSVHLTADGAMIGSPLFAAPEATLDEGPDPRSDLYSLGATAWWLLTGRPVFKYEKPLKVLFAHANEAPQPPSGHNPAVPADVDAIVLRCLAKSRDDRYATAAELDAALADCACAGEWSSAEARQWWLERIQVHSPERETEVGGLSATVQSELATQTIAGLANDNPARMP